MTNHQTILICRIQEAIRLANISVYLGMSAIVCFCLFGTLASTSNFKDSQLIYIAFHYLPYVLIAFSIPISLYHVFILVRYRIVQQGILKLILALAFGLMFFALAMWIKHETTAFFMSVFLTMVAWFAMPFLFRVNLKKFLKFLQDTTP